LIEFRLATPGTGGDLSADPWTWRNVKGDMLAMLFNFVFWSFVLFLIEIGCGKQCSRCYYGCCKKKGLSGEENIDLDVNVLEE
jgi:hypothetical protein